MQFHISRLQRCFRDLNDEVFWGIMSWLDFQLLNLTWSAAPGARIWGNERHEQTNMAMENHGKSACSIMYVFKRWFFHCPQLVFGGFDQATNTWRETTSRTMLPPSVTNLRSSNAWRWLWRVGKMQTIGCLSNWYCKNCMYYCLVQANFWRFQWSKTPNNEMSFFSEAKTKTTKRYKRQCIQ